MNRSDVTCGTVGFASIIIIVLGRKMLKSRHEKDDTEAAEETEDGIDPDEEGADLFAAALAAANS